jgi:repressor LexA
VNGEATLKRLYREAEGRVRLQPSNEKLVPIRAREEDVQVQGIVVGLMRRY